jgi:DNA polymerase-3 subunit epsilon
MLSNLFGINFTRKQYLGKTTSSVMKAFYSSPFPDKNSLINQVEIVAIDFETTGLDLSKDHVISIGTVDIVNLGVQLKSTFHQLISSDINLPETSVVIHQITDNALTEGEKIETVLPQLLEHLTGKVLLAHNAKVEVGFLNRMCQDLYDTKFIMPVIDTQFLARRSFKRNNTEFKSNDLRLFNLRESMGMPAFKAHNALMDAIATAELFLALVCKISPKCNARLKEFLT